MTATAAAKPLNFEPHKLTRPLQPPRDAVCPICSRPFEAWGSTKYCSKPCKREANRRSNALRYAGIREPDRDLRAEAGRYKTPGSVTLAPDPDPSSVAAVWAAAFKEEFALVRNRGEAGKVCACRVERRTCARCGTTYCNLCMDKVHPVCSLK